MPYFPIVHRKDQPKATPGHRQLPLFYMQDFSVLGLRVNDCDQAIRVLDQRSISLKRAEDGKVEIDIEKTSRMHEVIQLLNDNGLECELADVAEGMYQG